MEITRVGRIPGDIVWNGECRNYKSQAKAKQSELTGITNDQRDGSHCRMKCPVCNTGPFNGMLFYPENS